MKGEVCFSPEFGENFVIFKENYETNAGLTCQSTGQDDSLADKLG